MRAGRPLYLRFRSSPGPSRGEVFGSLLFFAALGALGWLCRVAWGAPL